ncbi:hypothetical protein TrRE_jg4416 [Triparma retinervis]|uniref:Uncharacterized protein n=1 Tax=Triparma retinervis TaxID=2557542 RepID=A0A9W7CEM8_9STRA|nr:hypothetical protein TrRE_jg4416 [Triparma retinervis]
MIILEVAGTVAEFVTADGLLKGLAPLDNARSFLGWKTNAQKLAIRQVEPIEEVRVSSTGIETNCQVYCAGVLVIIAIAEAAAIFGSSLLFLVYKINPTSVGSEAISTRTVLANFAIMFVGEFILTDGVLAVAAHYWKKRYINDPAFEWSFFRNRYGFVAALVVMMNMMQSMLCIFLPMALCMTSTAERGVESWVITQCPPFPSNITDLSQVGYSWVQEWEAAKDKV